VTRNNLVEAERALRQEITYLTDTLELLQDAGDAEDILRAYRRVCAHRDGDAGCETTADARINLESGFRERGLWDDENNRPDYDAITEVANGDA